MCESTNLSKGTLFHITKFTEDFFPLGLPFRFNQFESIADCTCANNDFFLARYKNPSVCTFYIL